MADNDTALLQHMEHQIPLLEQELEALQRKVTEHSELVTSLMKSRDLLRARVKAASSGGASSEGDESAGAEADGSSEPTESLIEGIERIIRSAPNKRFSNKEIRAELRKTPRHAERLENNQNYMYTALLRLKKKGVLTKFRDGRYQLAKERPESAEAASGVAEEGVGAPSSVVLYPQRRTGA